MKKSLTMFALATSSILTSCSQVEKNPDFATKQTITLDDQVETKKTSIGTPCQIEVPFKNDVIETVSGTAFHKFYDFCDSTVILAGFSNGAYGGPALSVRQMKDLQGDEKQEAIAAGKRYNSMKLKN